MKRALSAVALALLAALVCLQASPVGARSSVWAMPLYQEQKPVIAQPEQDSSVRGVVQIVGTAAHAQFQRYEIYYAPWPVPADNAWIFIGPDAHFQQQPLGLLGTWDSRAVPDGAYGLRVRVVKKDGNYLDSDPRRVVVANTKPAETPTPAGSPTPNVSPTPAPTLLPPTAVTIATVPAGSKATTPAPTRAPAAATSAAATAAAGSSTGGSTTPLPGADPTSLISTAGEILNLGRLADTAQTAAMLTVGAFAAIGLFFGVKALLYWLWLRIRP